MGDSITEGTLEKFLKFPGDKVQVDEVVALIETDKVTLDVRSTKSGEIRELKVSEGDSVVVGQEIMSYVPCLVEDTVTQEDTLRRESNAEDDDSCRMFRSLSQRWVTAFLKGSLRALSSKRREACEKGRVDSANRN